jgi:hypothetical protein
MNDEIARRRAFALALVALEALPEGKRPDELMDRFKELLARPGMQGLHPSIMLTEAKRLLRPDLDPNLIDDEYGL